MAKVKEIKPMLPIFWKISLLFPIAAPIKKSNMTTTTRYNLFRCLILNLEKYPAINPNNNETIIKYMPERS
jgi:hypothetical protein